MNEIMRALFAAKGPLHYLYTIYLLYVCRWALPENIYHSPSVLELLYQSCPTVQPNTPAPRLQASCLEQPAYHSDTERHGFANNTVCFSGIQLHKNGYSRLVTIITDGRSQLTRCKISIWHNRWMALKERHCGTTTPALVH